MHMRFYLPLLLIAVTVSGCKSPDGIYTPGCAAYEGDTVELHDGRFEWDKFTDQVMLDDREQVIDQFPAYPKAGSFSVTDGAVRLVADDGSRLPEMYFIESNGRYYLLTQAQIAAWRATASVADCALVLGGA